MWFGISAATNQTIGEDAFPDTEFIILTIEHNQAPKALAIALAEVGNRDGTAERDWTLQIRNTETILAKGRTFVIKQETFTL